MSDTTAKNVELIAPELAVFICQNGDLVALILEDVAGQISSAKYGAKEERAQRYLAAHFISLAYSSSQGGGGSGPVVSEKVGDVATGSITMECCCRRFTLMIVLYITVGSFRDVATRLILF